MRLIKTPLFLLSLSYVFCRKRYPAIRDFLEKFPAPSAPYLHRVCTCELEEDGSVVHNRGTGSPSDQAVRTKVSPFPLPSRLLATMAVHTCPPPGTWKWVTEPQAAPPQAPSGHARTIPGNLRVCWSPRPQVGGPRGRPQAVWPGDLPVHLCPLRSGKRGPLFGAAVTLVTIGGGCGAQPAGS